jgi:hypothetical protein
LKRSSKSSTGSGTRLEVELCFGGMALLELLGTVEVEEELAVR